MPLPRLLLALVALNAQAGQMTTEDHREFQRAHSLCKQHAAGCLKLTPEQWAKVAAEIKSPAALEKLRSWYPAARAAGTQPQRAEAEPEAERRPGPEARPDRELGRGDAPRETKRAGAPDSGSGATPDAGAGGADSEEGAEGVAAGAGLGEKPGSEDVVREGQADGMLRKLGPDAFGADARLSAAQLPGAQGGRSAAVSTPARRPADPARAAPAAPAGTVAAANAAATASPGQAGAGPNGEPLPAVYTRGFAPPPAPSAGNAASASWLSGPAPAAPLPPAPSAGGAPGSPGSDPGAATRGARPARGAPVPRGRDGKAEPELTEEERREMEAFLKIIETATKTGALDTGTVGRMVGSAEYRDPERAREREELALLRTILERSGRELGIAERARVLEAAGRLRVRLDAEGGERLFASLRRGRPMPAPAAPAQGWWERLITWLARLRAGLFGR